jgi:hypothetical protein
MSVLLPEASFEERVTDLWTALRGTGLMLSALDSALVADWGKTGVPIEVVARGFHLALEASRWDARPGKVPLRTLRACRRHVEEEIRRHFARAAGASMNPRGDEESPRVAEQYDSETRSVLEGVAIRHPHLEKHLQALCHRIFMRPALDVPQAERRRVSAAYHLLRALPFAQRRRLFASARLRAWEGLPLSTHARKAHLRFHLCRAIWEHLSATAFW